MTTIKISKAGQYYISKNGKRLTEDFLYIEQINPIHFAIHNDPYKNWIFFNSESETIDLQIENGRIESTQFREDTFTFKFENKLKVYNKSDLTIVLTMDEIKKEDQFYYISNGYSILNDRLFKFNEPLELIDNYKILFENKESNIILREIENFTLIYRDKSTSSYEHRCYRTLYKPFPKNIKNVTLDDDSFRGYDFKGPLLIVAISDSEFQVRIEDKIVSNRNLDFIESKNVDVYSFTKQLIDTAVKRKGQNLSENIEIIGPFHFRKFVGHKIFKNRDYKIYIKDKLIIKYNYHTLKLTISPSPFDFEIHGNVKNEMLYHNSKEYARLSVGYDSYFYNDLTEEFTQLNELVYIRPYLYNENICYLDENLTERIEKVKFDILDSIITDYSYYNNKLYVIIREDGTVGPNGESILYNVTERKILKTFNSFVSFASHKLFLINEQEFRSSGPIYTLDNTGSKVIKLPFNARSIYERNNKLLLYDKNYKNLKLSLEDSIYIKEK